ncbi:efflux RND transporter permease subunit [Seleniivibrio woodruffii]|uniref:efflux RND transporter permease subunit n=1 Tax=Seleniivibrio woodruffii TaxID=1078050 RepID=UPI0026F05C60|nr:CusA/CzcA family heavy metal efflux RND transporter [Seleniivibrio woodruffii]
MIEKLIGFSARNKFLVILFILAAVGAGLWSAKKTPLDAIPDLSDVQVIVFTEWSGRSPDLVEDQITYPIVSSLLAAPKVKVVRGYSFFGFSYVYAIFDDGTDIYWARSRVLENISKISGKLPPDVNPALGPDATGVGWIYQYALVDKSGRHDLSELRSYQDWYLKYALEEVKGVAELASVGGQVKEYQINIDPDKLRGYGISLNRIVDAVRDSNRDTGGRSVELSGRDFMVKGIGYIKNPDDIGNIVIKNDGMGVPVLVSDVASVETGPAMRRGIADFNGEGEAVGGVVVMRYGENALNVINNVKEKIEALKPSLPEGVEIVPVYDRSTLIVDSIKTLRDKLIEEIIIVSLVCIVFLFHFRSALVAILTLPVAIVMSFIMFRWLGITSNIMSLGGIAIAIGAMVDAAIVMVENAHKQLEHNPDADRKEVIIAAAQKVGKPLFFSLLIITVSFLPVFALEAQEGRLFKPLAYTKTFSMMFASILSVTLVPALMVIFIKGKIRHEQDNPITKALVFLYNPFVQFALKYRYLVMALAVISMVATYPVVRKLGSEFMPVLNEGTIFYMPTTLPGISASEAAKSLQAQNGLIKSVPEVDAVFGKAGNATTATDPAGLSMAETVITLKPHDQWRKGMTFEKLTDELNDKVKVAGWVNSWTMPIKARIDMLSTGIKTPVGIKVFGADPAELQKIGQQLESSLMNVDGTRSVYSERTDGGYYLYIEPDMFRMSRYGITVEDVNMVIESAIGGMPVTKTVEGRERYPVAVRYKKAFRNDVESIKNVLVPVGGMNGQANYIPLGDVADVYLKSGPDMLKEENGMLVSYVYVDLKQGVDVGSYVKRAMEQTDKTIKLPQGYTLRWSGEYESMQRVKEKLKLAVPLTLGLIFMLLYLNFRSVTKTAIVMLSVPFALVGGFLYLYFLGYNMSVAVWVGLIALAGVAAETGVVMIVYLDEAYDEWTARGQMNNDEDLKAAVVYGAVQRVRPKVMTVATLIIGLVPIMWATGSGADVMKRIAAPMIGGMVTSTILTLVIIPALYFSWKKWEIKKRTV